MLEISSQAGIKISDTMKAFSEYSTVVFFSLPCSSLTVIIPGGGGGLPYETDGDARRQLRCVNFGFWSRLGCSGQSANILCRQHRIMQRQTEVKFSFNLFCLPHCLCDYKLKSKISTNSREHYNPI